MRQGDPLSPNLFNCFIEEVFRNLNWENKGIRIDGKYLNNLMYADDVVLIAKNIEQLGVMLTELITEGGKAGLNINF